MTTLRIVPPAKLAAHISLPPSKSIGNRLLLIQALSGSPQAPHNLSPCDDSIAMQQALTTTEGTIDIGAAGTAMRFLTAYFAGTPGTHTLTGIERMRQRPIGVLVDALRQLGADIVYEENEGYPPLRIRGRKLRGGELSMPGNISSQYISALLLLAPTLQQGLTLHLTGRVVSRTYIDLTLGLMCEQGAEAQWTDDHTLRVEPKPYVYHATTVEADWSAASYWYELVALHPDSAAKVTLTGLQRQSLQGDSGIRELFAHLGVNSWFNESGSHLPSITLTRCSPQVERVNLDLSNMPDMAQTLAVTCCALNIPFHFTGLETLRIKETDRLAALQKELGKTGFTITIQGNNALYWDGQRQAVSAAGIDTYADHRMALSFAPLSTCLPELSINNPEVVSKSYPDYWQHLEQAGFTLLSPTGFHTTL